MQSRRRPLKFPRPELSCNAHDWALRRDFTLSVEKFPRIRSVPVQHELQTDKDNPAPNHQKHISEMRLFWYAFFNSGQVNWRRCQNSTLLSGPCLRNQRFQYRANIVGRTMDHWSLQIMRQQGV
jgi:hypothetical protein